MHLSQLIANTDEDKKKLSLSKQIGIFRLMLLMCAPFPLLLRVLFLKENSNVYDPLEIEILFCLSLWATFLITFNRRIIRYILHVKFVLFTSYTTFLAYLVYKNHFASSFVIELILFIIIIAIILNSKKQIYVYLSFVFVSYSILCVLTIGSALYAAVNIVLIGIFCLAIKLFFDSKNLLRSQFNYRDQLLQTIFNESPDALFIIDPDTFEIGYCNNRTLQLLRKKSRRLVINKTLSDCLQNAIDQNDILEIQSSLSKDINFEKQLNFHVEENVFFWGSVYIKNISIGNYKYWLARITDISDKVRTDDIVAESRNRLVQVIDMIPHNIFLKDNEGKFLLVNKNFEESHGLASKDIIGKTDMDLTHPEEAAKFMADDLEVMNSRKKMVVPEEILTTPSGEKSYLQTIKIPFFNEQSEKPGVLGISMNITERLRDKQLIEENQKMLLQVIDLVPHPIFLKDENCNFVFVNKNFLEMTGADPVEIIGKNDFHIFPHEVAEVSMNNDREVIRTKIGKYLDGEVIENKKGIRYLFQTTKIPFHKEDSNVPWLLGISIDIRERIDSQTKLEENRKILKEIINSLEHNIYLKDYEGRFRIVNKSCAAIYGMSEEEMVGKTDYDFYPAELADEFRRIELEIMETGNAMIIPEEYSTDKHGRSFVKNVNKMPFYFSQNEKTGVLGINIDITEAKLAEIALKESETKYKTLMNQASDGIYLSDNMGVIIEANPKACEMFGYSMEEFIGKNIKDMSFTNSGSNFLLRIPDLKDKQSILLERKLKKKDGTPFTVELSVKLLNDGKHQAILRDITERKKLEGILKDSEKKFRALIENSSDVMLILSEDLQVKFVSNSVSRILGFEANQLMDGHFTDLVHSEEHDIINKLLSQVLLDPGSNHSLDQLRIKNLNNEFRFFEIVAVNLISDRVINGIIVNCHDITKRKITENELINTNFELDSFVYKASHDLKAPLRSVMGLIKLAKLESKDINLNVYLDMMNKSVQSLDLFIKDLTQFSRNSRTDVEAKKIDFNEIIADTLSNLKFMENAALINVVQRIQLRSDFYSDPTRISTIINNLISNAYKYHRFENNSPYINIIVKGDYDKCVIEVEDNGTGIDPLHIDKIFEMFYRASESSYGSGLGLYIVKNAINRLKGTISLKSEINKGTTFTIVLPNLNNIEQL